MSPVVDDDVVELPDGREAQLWHGGSVSGPLVVYLHGMPDSRLTARTGDAAAVRAGVHLVAVNRPGYGRSDSADSDLDTVADDTVAVTEALAVTRFAVLGASEGASYALACAARHPDRVGAVGVVAGPVAAPGLATEGDLHTSTDGPDSAALAAMLADGDRDGAAEAARAVVTGLATAVLDDDDATVVRRWTEAMPAQDAELIRRLPPAEVARGVREALRRPDGFVRDVLAVLAPWSVPLADVRAPAFLWYGGQDPLVPVDHGRWLADRLPGASLVVRDDDADLATLLLHWDDVLSTLRDALE